MSALPPTTDDTPMWDLWQSMIRMPVVTAADEVGIFKAVSDEPLTTEELASKIGVDARMLSINLAGLASLGYLDKRDGRWSATHIARTWLHPEAEGYWGKYFKEFPATNPLHDQFVTMLKTGRRPKHREDDKPEWELGAMSAEVANAIAGFMNTHSQAASRGAAVQPEFRQVASVLDVGCGSGIYGIQMALHNPDLKVGLMDLKEMCAEVDKYIAKFGVGGQARSHSVNMFTEQWPTEYESHFYANVMHDWSDETNRILAKKSFDALPSGGRIFLSEILMDDDGTGPWQAAAFALAMMAGTLGKQYSLPEFRDILESAGFTDVRARRTGGGYYSLVSARKP